MKILAAITSLLCVVLMLAAGSLYRSSKDAEKKLVHSEVEVSKLTQENYAFSQENRALIDDPDYRLALKAYEKYRDICTFLRGAAGGLVLVNRHEREDLRCTAILQPGDGRQRLNYREASLAKTMIEAARVDIPPLCARILPDRRPKICPKST